jgi:hypothetical protein
MSSFDSVQLQWQYIRSTEREQCTERENVNLRKELKDLTLKLQDASSNTSLNDKLAKDLTSMIKKFSTFSKADMMKLKLAFIQELSALMKEKQILSEAFSKLIGLVPAREKEIEILKAKNRELSLKNKEVLAQLDSMKCKDAMASSDQKNLMQDAAKLRSVIKRLKEELSQEEKKSIELKNEVGILSYKHSQMHDAKEKAEVKCETMKHDNKNLQTKMEKFANEHRQNFELLQADYHEAMDKLMVENEYLRKGLREAELQIQKMKDEMSGNKSQFAKYIEVKTENVLLQSKLDNITKKPNKLLLPKRERSRQVDSSSLSSEIDRSQGTNTSTGMGGMAQSASSQEYNPSYTSSTARSSTYASTGLSLARSKSSSVYRSGNLNDGNNPGTNSYNNSSSGGNGIGSGSGNNIKSRAFDNFGNTAQNVLSASMGNVGGGVSYSVNQSNSGAALALGDAAQLLRDSAESYTKLLDPGSTPTPGARFPPQGYTNLGVNVSPSPNTSTFKSVQNTNPNSHSSKGSGSPEQHTQNSNSNSNNNDNNNNDNNNNSGSGSSSGSNNDDSNNGEESWGGYSDSVSLSGKKSLRVTIVDNSSRTSGESHRTVTNGSKQSRGFQNELF